MIAENQKNLLWLEMDDLKLQIEKDGGFVSLNFYESEKRSATVLVDEGAA